MRPFVPTAPFLPILREYLATYETAQATEATKSNKNDYRMVPPSPETALAFQAGLCVEVIYRIVRGQKKQISFDTADKLLCAMNLVHLWRANPELQEIYLSANLNYPRDNATRMREYRQRVAA